MLRVVFSDGHVTELSADWLYNRRFTEAGKQERREHIQIRKPVIWGDNYKVKSCSYEEVSQ